MTQDMTHTYDKPAIARSVARMLLEIEAVLFRADDPFTLTSGMKSPVYIDCRKIIAFPRMRAQMMDYGRTVIMNDIGYESLDAVAGGETAGIPFAAWLAERTGLPMHYVRKKPKGFGRDARIEGDIRDGQRVLLVEDLATDGGSKLSFVEAIRTAGAEAATPLSSSIMTSSRTRRSSSPPKALSCTICRPGGMCWRQAASREVSTRTRCRRSKPFFTIRAAGQKRMAAPDETLHHCIQIY